MAPGSDHAPLVEGQRAEIAPPEAPPVVGHREADLLNGGHAPQRSVHRVDLPGKGEGVDGVQLLPVQRHGGRVHHQHPVPVALADGPAPDGVVLLILHFGGEGIVPLVGADSLEGGDLYVLKGANGVLRRVGGAPDIGEALHRLPLCEALGNLPRSPLPHAVDQEVRPGVEEDGAADFIVPVVVVGKAAQAPLQPADDDGQAGEGLPGPARVDDGGPVGAQAHLVPGAVGVAGAALFGGGVVGHHGVDVPAADEHAVPGPPHGPEGVRTVPIRLGEDRRAEPQALQAPGDEGGAEAGVVDIGVGGDHQKVVVPPIPPVHVLQTDRQEVEGVHRGLLFEGRACLLTNPAFRV